MQFQTNISLDKRTGNHAPKKFLCPSCNKKTFVRYYDFAKNEYLPDHFGRCDRENNCSYHLAPDKDYFRGTGDIYKPSYVIPKPKQAKEVKPDLIDVDLVNQTFLTTIDTHNNYFVHFLSNHFGEKVALRMVNKYRIATSKHWQGANIFWQVDINENIRTGKIMLYNPQTCKRVKQPYNHVTWVHSELLKKHNLENFKQIIKSFNLVQCFFGEHLLNTELYPEHSGRVIAIVESAKTAIIADECLKHLDYIWLSAEGSTGLQLEKCKVLKKREVILFPDLDSKDENFAKWTARGEEIAKQYRAKVEVSRALYGVATSEEKANGLDLGDYLLRLEYDKERQILLSPYFPYPFSWDV